MTIRKDPRLPISRASVIAAMGQRQAADRVIGIDGRPYTQKTEDEINRISALTLGTETGRRLLEYLKNITLNTPLPASASDAELRHMEGQRFIVAVLVNRLKAGSAE